MSYTSANGRWIETAGLAALFEADKPVSVLRALTLINNVNHLRDTSTFQRVSHCSYVGETVTAIEAASDSVNATPVKQFTTPWSLLEPLRPARALLRIGAYRAAAGTSYVSAGLFPFGARQDATGFGAIAWWPEETFTNTTAAVVLSAAAHTTWQPLSPGAGSITILGREIPSGGPVTDGRTAFGTTDPIADGTFTAARPNVLMVTLAIFVRTTGGTSDTRIVYVDLREFSGP